MHRPVVYYHDNVETHTHAHTHQLKTKSIYLNHGSADQKQKLGLGWAVLGSSSGHAGLTPCLAIGWCIWAKCVSPAGYPRHFPGRGRGENGIFLG